MTGTAREVYAPLNTLKQVAPDVWIVDGHAIGFGPSLLKMPFPTRMTVVRTGGERLFIHSPTPLAPELWNGIARIGEPRWIIAPNRLHYWWVPEWRAAFPDADVHLAPRVREQAKGRIDFGCAELSGESGYPWDGEIATLPVAGRYMTEFAFFHRTSRTLILTDLIENFETERLGSPLVRLLTRLGGVRDPDGQTPRDMRVTFDKPVVRAAVERMIAWDPKRVVLAHGRWYETDAVAELRRAFRWALD